MATYEPVTVTGGSGFIGSALVSALRTDGVPVVVIDRLPWAQARRLHQLGADDGLTYHGGEVTNADRLRTYLADGPLVYHLAANTDNRGDRAGRTADFTDTVGGTVALLEALADRSAPATVVMTSSQLVYGASAEGGVITERTGRRAPTTRFAAGKVAAEAFLQAYAHEHGIRAAACRLSNIVGPGMSRGIVYDIVQRLKVDAEEIQLLGDGRQTRSYLHVTDCVAALRTAARDPGAFSAFNVCNVDAVTAFEVAQIIASELTSRPFRVTTQGGERGRRGDVPTLIVRPEALGHTGWRPCLTSAEAIRHTARAMLRLYSMAGPL